MRFEETRHMRDVYHQRYVRADKSGHCSCARMRGMRFTASGAGRIWAHVTATISLALFLFFNKIGFLWNRYNTSSYSSIRTSVCNTTEYCRIIYSDARYDDP